MAKHGIKLRRLGMRVTNRVDLGVFRIRVEVIDTAIGTDPRIFLMHRGPIDPYTSTYTDYYSKVCNVTDLSEYPPEAPDPQLAYPFFRVANIEADLRSLTDLDTFWGLIKADVCDLMAALDMAEDLILVEDHNCGALPNSASSSSISISG